jgi:hypothetical protein
VRPCKTRVSRRTPPCTGSFPAVDALERYVRAGLELAGDEVDDVDLAVIRAADAVYGPGLAALDAADLTHVLPEPDLDPARAPRPL